jgi:hypothetical protein
MWPLAACSKPPHCLMMMMRSNCIQRSAVPLRLPLPHPLRCVRV